jgi:hypothetical protein
MESSGENVGAEVMRARIKEMLRKCEVKEQSLDKLP